MGYSFVGAAAGDRAGIAAASVGDIDGDGRTDLLIGADENDGNGLGSGVVYLIAAADLAGLDAADGLIDGVIDLGLVGAHGGYVLTGSAPSEQAGSAVASAGDVDGDGRADLLVGASATGAGGDGSGVTYLVSAADLVALDAADGLIDGVIDLGHAAAQGGYAFTGAAASDGSGISVASAGDVDGDGLSDLLIGAVLADGNGADSGASYLVTAADLAALDAADGLTDGVIDLGHVGAQGGYTFTGGAAGDRAGISVTSAGDVDGDGRADLLIGAYFADGGGSSSGETYLITANDLAGLDSADGLADGVIDLGNVGLHGGHVLIGRAAGDQSGSAVAAAGDVDGDGRADLLIGAPLADPEGRANSGRAYLVSATDLAALDAADGLADGVIDLDSVGTHGGYTFTGVATADRAGGAVASAGDVDGDGQADLLIGAPNADIGGFNTGTTYLIAAADLAGLDAADGATDGVISLGNVGAHGGYALIGVAAGDLAGRTVASAGDVDGDGRDDLLIGAHLADGGGSSSGEAYLILAKDLAAADAADGTSDGIIALANAPICFVRGTRIATSRGPVPVEDLRPGDRVLTMDEGYRPLVWTGRTTRLAYGKMAPVRIAAGALGNLRDLWVSPQHRMLLSGAEARAFGAADAAFVPAIRLVNGDRIRQVEGGTVE